MKGAISFLLEIIIALIVIAVIGIGLFVYLYGTRDIPSPGSSDLSPRAPGQYPQFVLNPNGYSSFADYVDSEPFCENLKNCIKTSLISGRSCDFPERVSFGTDFRRNYDIRTWDALTMSTNCEEEDLSIELAPGINQSVCRFESPYDFNYNGISDFISDAAGLSFNNCSFSPYVTVSDLFNPVEETISKDDLDNIVNVYFTIDRLYTPNYQHLNPDINKLNADSWYNGPGRLQVSIGKAIRGTNGLCVYTLRYCVQSSFATDNYDSTIEIYKEIASLQMWHIVGVPYYINAVSSKPDIYYFNDITIKLNRPFHATEIVNAIKTGLYDNAYKELSKDIWSHPHWTVGRDGSLTFDSSWSPSFDTRLTSNNVLDKSREIWYNCGSDNICNKEIKIKVAIRRDYTTNDGSKAFISLVISFVEGGI